MSENIDDVSNWEQIYSAVTGGTLVGLGVIVGWVGSNEQTVEISTRATQSLGAPVSPPPVWLLALVALGLVLMVVEERDAIVDGLKQQVSNE